MALARRLSLSLASKPCSSMQQGSKEIITNISGEGVALKGSTERIFECGVSDTFGHCCDHSCSITRLHTLFVLVYKVLVTDIHPSPRKCCVGLKV